jgi:hypothetical protein
MGSSIMVIGFSYAYVYVYNDVYGYDNVDVYKFGCCRLVEYLEATERWACFI